MVGGGGGSRTGGVWLDVNEELKFLGKFKKNVVFFLGGVWGRVGLGAVGLGGSGGCERRIEVFVKIQKKNWGGGVGGRVGGRVGEGSG